MSTEQTILGIGLVCSALSAVAEPYAPAAGQPGSTAIAGDSTLFVAWATGYTNYQPGAECWAAWQTPARALGPPSKDPTNIVCLGRSGQITFTFDLPIADGPGPDFAVFENAVTDSFLELAFVEVSSDGTTFERFPTHSLSPQSSNAIPNFQTYYATNIHGFAGKYRHGFGTPFDLAELPAPHPLLDLNDVRYIRLIDIVGDGSSTDSFGNAIYDPYPMIESAGLDVNAVGVIQFPTVCTVALDTGSLQIEWHAVTNRWYQPQYADAPDAPEPWTDLGPLVVGDNQPHHIAFTNQISESAVFRVERRDEP